MLRECVQIVITCTIYPPYTLPISLDYFVDMQHELFLRMVQLLERQLTEMHARASQ